MGLNNRINSPNLNKEITIVFNSGLKDGINL